MPRNTWNSPQRETPLGIVETLTTIHTDPPNSPDKVLLTNPKRKSSSTPCEYISQSQSATNLSDTLTCLLSQSLRLPDKEKGRDRKNSHECRHNYEQGNKRIDKLIILYKNFLPLCELCSQPTAFKRYSPDPGGTFNSQTGAKPKLHPPDSSDIFHYPEGIMTVRPPPEPDPKQQSHRTSDATKQRNATEPEDQSACRPTRMKKLLVTHNDASQNEGVIVEPVPEPLPIDCLIEKPVILSAVTHGNQDPNLPEYHKTAVLLSKYFSQSYTPICN